MAANLAPVKAAANSEITAMQTMLNQSVSEAAKAMAQRIASAQSAREAQAAHPAPATAPAQEIPHAVFMQHLQAMQLHYGTATAAGSTAHLYALPATVLHPAAAKAPISLTLVLDLAGSKAVDAAIAQTHSDALAYVTAHAGALMNAVAEADRTKNTANWAQKMNALRDRDKTEAKARIDSFYSRLADLGKAHPAQRARILQVTNHGGGLLATLFAGAQSTADAVGKTVSSAFQAIASPVKTITQTVGGWASGAVKSVGSVLGKLF